MSTSAATPQTLEEHQQEVQRLLGQVILRLQLFEQQLKALLATADLRFERAGSGEMQQVEGIATGGKTLGQLVGLFCDKILTTEPPGALSDADSMSGADVSLRLSFRSQIAPDRLEALQEALRELVAMRNMLVHHFIEDLDLFTIEGCLAAQTALTEKLEITRQRLTLLADMARDFETTRARVRDALNEGPLHDWLSQGLIPWQVTDIVAGLLAASEALAVDGWTAVDAASRWITCRDPGQAPQNYDCSGWRHLIHSTGLFDLRYDEREGRRLALYRPRPGAKAL